MLFGCCTSIDNIALLERHGYDRIILSAVDVMSMSPEALDRARILLTEGPVKCRALNSFCPPTLKLCGEGYDPEAVRQYGSALVEKARTLGVTQVGIGAPKSRSIPEDFDKALALAQFKNSLTLLCDLFATADITVLLEAVCSLECNFITTTGEALAVITALGRPNLALVFDTYHAFMMDEDALPLRRAMDHVVLVHTAQNIDGRRHYLRRDKLAEYKVYFDALMAAGYKGEVSVEAFFDDIDEQLQETLSITKILCLQ